MIRKLISNHLHNPLPDPLTKPVCIFYIEAHVHLGVNWWKRNRNNERNFDMKKDQLWVKYIGRHHVRW